MKECLLYIKIRHLGSKIQDIMAQLFWSRKVNHLSQTYDFKIVGFELKFQLLHFKIFWAFCS